MTNPSSPTALLAAISLCIAIPSAHAQFVRGNEAVGLANGQPFIQTPPLPAKAGKPCAAAAPCHAGAWRMVETASGLMECTEPWARPTTCRPSTYGAEKLRRVWVVRRGGTWLQCQYPDIGSRCAPIFARPPGNLPADAIQ